MKSMKTSGLVDIVVSEGNLIPLQHVLNTPCNFVTIPI